jgi:hypothetical protein
MKTAYDILLLACAWTFESTRNSSLVVVINYKNFVYISSSMKVVYSIRIDKSLREEMENYNIRWSEEIEKYIAKRIEELKKEEILREVENKLKGIKGGEPGEASRLVRENRDSN